MASKQKSLAEIIKEMREFGNHCAAFGGSYSPASRDNLLRCIEAAHKRELEAKDERIKELENHVKNNARRFVIVSNDDGSFWVSVHRWLLGECSKATIFNDPFYAKQVVLFEKKSEAGRSKLPQVYELMDDCSRRFVPDDECK